jgi:hypothetical protein
VTNVRRKFGVYMLASKYSKEYVVRCSVIGVGKHELWRATSTIDIYIYIYVNANDVDRWALPLGGRCPVVFMIG